MNFRQIGVLQSPSRGPLMRMLRPLRRALPLSSTMADRIENRGRTAHMGALALETGRRIRLIFLLLATPLLYFAFTPPAYSQFGFPVPSFFTDFDGDGLLNSWEQNGIDVNGDAIIDVNLPALGASPVHKDIFVEIDFFDCTVTGGDCAATDTHTHRPLNLALQTVITAFANAPVPNLDGIRGINLRIVLDEELPHRQNCELGGTPSCFDNIKTTNFGTAADRADPNSANILAAKRLIFHYNLWVHNRAAGNGSSGLAEGGRTREIGLFDIGAALTGNDFLISLGSWAGQVGTVNDQTGTFMHELGHNLGLDHGGGSKTNCKPNYLSVMSYTFQVIGLQPGPVFDYSGDALPRPRRGLGSLPPLFIGLRESVLNETIGIRDGTFITFYGPPADLDGIDQGSNGDLTDDWLRGQGTGNIDWDNDGNPAERRVAADINNLEMNDCRSSPNQFLRGFNDWDNVEFNFRDSTDFADGVHTTAVEIQELDVETAEEIRESAGEIDTELPPPEQPVSDDCLIDTQGCLIDTEPPPD